MNEMLETCLATARHFKLSADQNDVEAQSNYGKCLLEGRGVVIDLEGAARYFKLAADQNSTDRQVLCGESLLEGKRVQKDLREAARCFKLAADQNDSLGRASHDRCLLEGFGVVVDYAEAARSSKLAADQNVAMRNRITAFSFSKVMVSQLIILKLFDVSNLRLIPKSVLEEQLSVISFNLVSVLIETCQRRGSKIHGLRITATMPVRIVWVFAWSLGKELLLICFELPLAAVTLLLTPTMDSSTNTV
jgi:hypothetical protein